MCKRNGELDPRMHRIILSHGTVHNHLLPAVRTGLQFEALDGLRAGEHTTGPAGIRRVLLEQIAPDR